LPPIDATRAKAPVPRSGAGRKRASHNAYRHGLNLSITSTAAFAKQLHKLVHEIVGNTVILERGRAVAQAEFEIAQVRRAKVALIERAAAFGQLDPPRVFSTVSQFIRLFNSLDRGQVASFPEPVDSSALMPSQEPYRSAEAIRRVLSELRKLDRYEWRAAGRRDQAVRALSVEFTLTAISNCK
jgi:hypothetical protein